jgi:glycosyltransferase involved in cell wall biosynthesis
MRIGFDARPLLGPRTGVGVWLEGLVRGLAAATDWSFALFLPRRAARLGLEDLGGRVVTVAPPLPLPGTLWLHTVAASEIGGRAEVFVSTLGVRPRRLTAPDVLVVHDVTPRTRPGRHTLANRLCFNAYFEESLAAAGAIVCVSGATRAAVARLQPGAARRAVVIGEGVDPFFTPAGDAGGAAGPRGRFAAGRPYIAQLGTLEPRKGIATLLAAHARLLERDPGAPDLVLAGGRGWGGGWLEAALAAHRQPERVHLPGYVSREDARELLRHAEVVTLVSEEEGFGRPLAEALACGAACVASDDPALVEVADGAARHVARGDAEALAAALAACLDPGTREALRAAARARAARLTWERPVAAWRGLLSEVAGGRARDGQLRMPGDAAARR